jgi:hypothetical protein
VIEVVAAAGFALAWFTFRYERHRRWRDAVEAAYGTLRAVHHGMVTGLTPGQAVGWGPIYFQQDLAGSQLFERVTQTRNSVHNRSLDQVFVVPTEPLAKLATTAPQDGLIDATTVAVANFALWRVDVFNQLVGQLTDFNAQHAVEIMSGDTSEARREALAETAAGISSLLHAYGIGWAWSLLPGGEGRGWYGTLIETIGVNMSDLETQRRSHRRRWWSEWPYAAGDVLVIAAVVAVVVTVVS